MADLYSLVHEDTGPVSTFTTLEEARNELEAVLDDEPSWITQVWIEPFTVVVAERADELLVARREGPGSRPPPCWAGEKYTADASAK